VFGLFFPVEVAIAMTAIVHFSNNLLKLSLFYRKIDIKVAFRFGVPSVIAAFLGAWLLIYLSQLPALANYVINNQVFEVQLIKLVIAVLLIFFSLMEIVPGLAAIHFEKKHLITGGFLSGFFGGLSGNQGALRSAFLIRAGLSKESFISTGVVIACMVDITRLSLYSDKVFGSIGRDQIFLLIAAVISAFMGVFIGNKLVKKMTLKSLQMMVAALLLVFALLLGGGII
jgi:uncharacterized protein